MQGRRDSVGRLRFEAECLISVRAGALDGYAGSRAGKIGLV